MKKTTLDILIPSYRASERHLLGMLNIAKPASLDVRFVVVLDNPGADIAPGLARRLEESDAVLIRNPENMGAPVSRNIALDVAAAEWVLFWDDDIVPSAAILSEYAGAIEREKNATGFVGPTYTPAPCNTFTAGILASDILTFWHLPKGYEQVIWGITANLLIRRSAIGDIRFLPGFPKFGGGEDIDFCIRIVKSAGAPFNVVWKAEVSHEWWNNGKRSYMRFMRWAYGDSVLPSLFPGYRYYNFPNAMEFVILGGGVSVAGLFFNHSPSVLLAATAGGAVLGEFFAEWAKQAVIKKNFSPVTAIESSLVRASNDLGRIAGHIKKIRPAGMMERFDYFGDGKHVRHEKIVAAIKFAAFMAFTCALLVFA